MNRQQTNRELEFRCWMDERYTCILEFPLSKYVGGTLFFFHVLKILTIRFTY